MANPSVGGHVHGLYATNRRDNWWLGPAATAAGLGFFMMYITWAGWQASYYAAGPYISPAYSPLLFVYADAPGAADASHALLGSTWPSWWPSFIPKSPNFMIVLLPVMFRSTCYYYRKAYYRAFFGTPPGCGVGPVPHNYQGETSILIFQNLHRYTLYLAILLLPFLFLDAFHSLFWDGSFGIGLGSIMIWGNAILLTGYTLGCHAWRHLIGGRLDCFSCNGGAEMQHQAWTWSSWFNVRHMNFAWTSLYWFLFADLYIRLLSMGYVPDINTWQGVTWMGA
jgi:hypothetical protein